MSATTLINFLPFNILYNEAYHSIVTRVSSDELPLNGSIDVFVRHSYEITFTKYRQYQRS